MRHRAKTKRFGRSSAHLAVLLASLVCALIKERRIVTTLSKAKSARSLAEKMVTLAKDGSLSARRRAIQTLGNKQAVKSLFADIAPNFKDRAGGYCRIVKTDSRRGDSAPMAMLEWIGLIQVDRTKKEKAEEKKQA
jgi:large subunit ribosomal protein L17